MESNYHQESINSSEKVEQENNDLGVGRSYECVFCKRGFNTAQALGGHMNIHRKDRARNKPTSNNSNKPEQSYTGPRLYQQIPASSYGNNQSANPRFASQDHQPCVSYEAYFPASTSRTRSLYGNSDHQQYCFDDSDRDHRQPSNPLIPAGDWRRSLSLEFSPTIIEDLDKNRQAMNQKEDLDLELRLGYD
ncbi:hypothetical protein Pfo_006407 [Paulownia fortunei]|nr:hypothetical protein Pfo_006407 [Paulownia fortunei]